MGFILKVENKSRSFELQHEFAGMFFDSLDFFFKKFPIKE